MVHINFPHALTEEEENLKMKYAMLRKKKKQLQALKTSKPEMQQKPPEQSAKRPAESTWEATVQAKKLVQSGAIKVGSGSREKMGFKRSNHLEKKLKDWDKQPPVVHFTPYTPSQAGEDGDKSESPKKSKNLHDFFVPESKYDMEREERRESDREERRQREPREHREPPSKGNTVYVHGVGVTEDILKASFSNFGKIINITMESERNNGFVTFDTMEAADQAISNMNDSMISNVQLKVSMARQQPTFDNMQDPACVVWSTIARSESQKGPSKNDRRTVVIYDEDIF